MSDTRNSVRGARNSMSNTRNSVRGARNSMSGRRNSMNGTRNSISSTPARLRRQDGRGGEWRSRMGGMNGAITLRCARRGPLGRIG